MGIVPNFISMGEDPHLLGEGNMIFFPVGVQSPTEIKRSARMRRDSDRNFVS